MHSCTMISWCACEVEGSETELGRLSENSWSMITARLTCSGVTDLMCLVVGAMPADADLPSWSSPIAMLALGLLGSWLPEPTSCGPSAFRLPRVGAGLLSTG